MKKDERWKDETDILSTYAPATPQLLDSRRLLKRTDTKFLFNRQHLTTLFSTLSRDYALLTMSHSVWQEYSSDYFDTDDLQMYNDHRRGRRIRQKVRLRHYLDREMTFLEVKNKRRSKETIKFRSRLPFLTRQLSELDQRFLKKAGAPPNLCMEPKLSSVFRRITLVGLKTIERVTFDLGLKVSNQQSSHRFRQAIIAEVKQTRFSPTSPIMLGLRACGIRPSRASKYCIGTMTLNNNIRSNRLKPSLRTFKGVNHD